LVNACKCPIYNVRFYLEGGEFLIMAKKMFVGSLPWGVDSAALQQMFEKYGQVISATVLKDRETGRSRGFGFVEMSNDDEADKAIAELNGSDMEGRKIVVNVARPRE
jgi:RNA recognition motif-containing protein